MWNFKETIDNCVIFVNIDIWDTHSHTPSHYLPSPPKHTYPPLLNILTLPFLTYLPYTHKHTYTLPSQPYLLSPSNHTARFSLYTQSFSSETPWILNSPMKILGVLMKILGSPTKSLGSKMKILVSPMKFWGSPLRCPFGFRMKGGLQ